MIKSTFFRQSGWMVFSSAVFGILMTAIHKVANNMGKAEYGVFNAMLLWVSQTGALSIGLQLAFAQQTANELETGKRAEIASSLRAVVSGLVVLLLLGAGAVFLFKEDLLTGFKINNPVTLWLTLLTAFMSLLVPTLWGVLQGRQDFLWLGWATMLNGLARCATIAGGVIIFGWKAAGAVSGVLLGLVVAAIISFWQIRDLLRGPSVSFHWLPWLKRVIPITLAMGSITFLLTQDGLVVQRNFSAEVAGTYAPVGIIGRALFFFTAPLTVVLFPKLVQSATRSEKSSVLAQAMGATCLMGGGAALICTLFPKLPVWVLYKPDFYPIASLVPLFGWCVLPLTLSTVLVNNLLARQRFAVVPWLVAVAVGYGVALQYRHDSFKQVIHTLGIFGLLLLAGCIVCTWWGQRPTKTPSAERLTG